MSTLKTIIIEDEQPAIDLLQFYLKDFSEIEIIAVCQDGFSGLKAINEQKPDLVFLDIQMPKLTGFEMIELLDHQPLIVFTTAFDEYAIKAFDVNAIDYLLKPYSLDRLKRAISKVVQTFEEADPALPSYQKLAEYHVSKSADHLKRIVVKTGSNIKLIPASEIIYIEAQDDYVMIYTREARFMKQGTMKYFETGLDPAVFIRIHRSYIVNVNEIKQIEPYEKESYIAILKNGAKLKISKTGFKTLKDNLNF
jgi:two-component system, LytTR family, response regulator